MFSSEEFWLSAVVGGAVGGVIMIVLYKLLENKGTGRRDTGAGNMYEKLPREHDERF